MVSFSPLQIFRKDIDGEQPSRQRGDESSETCRCEFDVCRYRITFCTSYRLSLRRQTDMAVAVQPSAQVRV